jgi:PIN domain nuclease of toxin-antitoxin system
MQFESSLLSPTVARLCTNPENELLVSVVILWEIAIKHQIGKLELQVPLEQVIKEQEQENGILFLPVYVSHILQVEGLPLHHKNPFDHLLIAIAQALAEDAVLLSDDRVFAQYPVRTIW